MTDNDAPRADDPGGGSAPDDPRPYIERVLGAANVAIQHAVAALLDPDDTGQRSAPGVSTDPPTRATALTCAWCPSFEHPEAEHHPPGSGAEHVVRHCAQCGLGIHRLIAGGPWHHHVPGADHLPSLAPLDDDPPDTEPVDDLIDKAKRYSRLVEWLRDRAHNETGTARWMARQGLDMMNEALSPDPEAKLCPTCWSPGVRPLYPAPCADAWHDGRNRRGERVGTSSLPPVDRGSLTDDDVAALRERSPWGAGTKAEQPTRAQVESDQRRPSQCRNCDRPILPVPVADGLVYVHEGTGGRASCAPAEPVEAPEPDDPDGVAGVLCDVVNGLDGRSGLDEFDVVDAESTIEALRERGYRIVPAPSADIDGALSKIMSIFESAGIDPAIRIEEGVRRLAVAREAAKAEVRDLTEGVERITAERDRLRSLLDRIEADGPRVPVRPSDPPAESVDDVLAKVRNVLTNFDDRYEGGDVAESVADLARRLYATRTDMPISYDLACVVADAMGDARPFPLAEGERYLTTKGDALIEALRERGYRVTPVREPDADEDLLDFAARSERESAEQARAAQRDGFGNDVPEPRRYPPVDLARTVADAIGEAHHMPEGCSYATSLGDDVIEALRARGVRVTSRPTESSTEQVKREQARPAASEPTGLGRPMPLTNVYVMLTEAGEGDPIRRDPFSGGALVKAQPGYLGRTWLAATDLVVGQRVAIDVPADVVRPVTDTVPNRFAEGGAILPPAEPAADPDGPDGWTPMGVTTDEVTGMAEWVPMGSTNLGHENRVELGADGTVTETVSTTRPAGHLPTRGSDVEAWIKRRRDHFQYGDSAWVTLDNLLDDYRDHADVGASLDREVGPCGTCAGRGCPDCRDDLTPEQTAEAIDAGLGLRSVAFTEDNDDALGGLMPSPDVFVSLDIDGAKVRLTNDGTAVVLARVGNQAVVLQRGDSAGLGVPAPVVISGGADKPKPAASPMPAGLAEARMIAVRDAIRSAGHLVMPGNLIQAFDEQGWTIVPHSLAQRYGSIDVTRLAAQIAERLPVLFERVSEDPNGGVMADESYYPMSATRTAELVEQATRAAIGEIPEPTGDDPGSTSLAWSPRVDTAGEEGGETPTRGHDHEGDRRPHEHEHSFGNPGPHHHHDHGHSQGAGASQPSEWSYTVPAAMWLALDNAGRNETLDEARRHAVAQFGPNVVRTWEPPSIDRRDTPHADDAVFITWKINQRGEADD